MGVVAPPPYDLKPALNTLAGQIVTSVEINALSSPVEITARIKAAIDANPGGIIQLPPMPLSIGVLPENLIGTNEGLAFKLVSGAYTTIRGVPGLTRLAPVSNRIEMFAQVGAESVSFVDLTFDNSQNGALQNEVKGVSSGPGTGVAGNGNTACCAVRQYLGAGLSFRNVEFRDFTTHVEYLGDYTDISKKSGTIQMDGVRFVRGVFGLLAAQPQSILLDDIKAADMVDAQNGSGSATVNDPGHALYVTNRSGAVPDFIRATNVTGLNNSSSTLKIRKGDRVEMSSVQTKGGARGVEAWNCASVIVSGVNVSLGASIDSNQCGIELTDCGHYAVSDCEVDVRGSASAWGIRLRKADSAVQEWTNRYGTITDCQVIVSNVGGGRAALIASDQDDLTISGFQQTHTGTAVGDRYPIDLRNCNNATVINPKHIATDGAADGYKLVSIDVTCTNTRVLYSLASVSGALTTNTISDAGTGTVISRVGSMPTGSLAAPAFAFDAEPTTGFWRPGASQLGVAINTFDAVRFYGNRMEVGYTIKPMADGGGDLGDAATRWNNAYIRNLILSNAVTYASEAAAAAAGLVSGRVYKTSDGAGGFNLKLKA